MLLTIALGVGSNAAVFGFLEGLIHPSPTDGSDRLVSIFAQDRSGNTEPVSSREYQLARGCAGAFEWIGAARIKQGESRIDGHSEIAIVAAVTPDLAGALSLPLGQGVVISHRVWKSEFSGSEGAVGSVVQIDGADFRVEGVAPDKLDGIYRDQSVDLWLPAKRQDFEGGGGERRDIWAIARLGENVSIRQAQAALRSGPAGLRELTVTPFTGLAPNMARGLARVGMFLTFSAAAVFFIACINVASLLLGRAVRRSQETSLRIALGATRADLLWDLFADSVVIAGAGGAVGLLLGFLTARALPAFLFEGDAERLSFAPHLLPIFTASLVCVVVTVLCGMMPVVGTVTDRPWMVLQRESGSPSKAILRLRSGLVVGQITACCMLVICTALLLDGLHSVMKTSAGHRLGDPVLVTVEAQPFLGPEIDVGYFNGVEQKAKSVTGVRPLAWTARLPGNQPMWRSFRMQQSTAEDRKVAMDIAWLTPESIQRLEGQPVAGKMFGLNDQKYRVAVVNEKAAAELFGRQTVGLVIWDSNDLPIEVIGVVKEIEGPVDHTKVRDTSEEKRPTIYYGYLHQAEPSSTIRDASFRIPREQPRAGIELSANVVSADYFSALDMALIAGQRFAGERISGEGRVAVINEEAANLYFNPKPLAAGVIDDQGVRTEIIGVVRSQAFGTFQQHAEPAIYFPMWQDCPARMTLMLKAPKWNRGMAAELRQKIENVPGGRSGAVAITTLDRQLAQSGLAALRIASLIGGTSAAIALMLSILGLLSAQSDAERQRQHDRALRLALGAQRWRVVLLVMTNAGQLAFLGAAIGVLLSVALMRILIAGVAIATPPSFEVWLIAPLLPVAAVLMVSMVPARRASAIAPAAIMRDM